MGQSALTTTAQDISCVIVAFKQCQQRHLQHPCRDLTRHTLQAISHHGGGSEVSKRLGWKQAYHPPNYWADLDNCRAELDTFCREVGVPQGTLPSVYSMQQAGRYDLQRAVRHWGGLSKMADALGYQVIFVDAFEPQSQPQ